MNDITTGYQLLRTKHAPNRVPTKEFDNIVSEKKEKCSVGEDDGYFELDKQLVYKRCFRGKHTSFGRGAISPVLHLETALVDLLITLADMNKPFTCGEGVQLANELVKDMELEKHLIAYKKKIKMHCGENGLNKDGTIFGKTWWMNFMRRVKHKLTSAKGTNPLASGRTGAPMTTS